MNYNNLSLEQAPSIKTPLRFFITAPFFLIAASLLLLFQGPDIFQNRWLPQTLALTHLISLGFVSMAIMGALFQLLPVLAGCNIPYANHVSTLVHALFTPGIAFLASGFLYPESVFHILAWYLLSSSLLIFLTAVSYGLLRSKSDQAPSVGIKFSIFSFWITVILGLMLLSSYAWQSTPLLRQYTELHISWAMVGWIVLMVFSVAYQVIPMFQITREYPDIVKRYFSWIIISSLFFWSMCRVYELNTGLSLGWLNTLTVILCSLTLLVFIYLSLKLLFQRKKRMADISLYFWITSLLSLSAGLLAFIVAKFSHLDLSITIGLLFFGGFAISVINGMLYKIIPFLIWLHLHRKQTDSGKRLSGIPTLYEIISHKKGLRQFISHILALFMSLMAILQPTLFFYPASLLWLLNGILLLIHLLQALHIYHAFLKTAP
jgi:hypothetical protein